MDNNTFPKRKRIRLDSYCYTQPGRFFITICAQDKRPIFSEIVENPTSSRECRNALPYSVELTDLGKIVDSAILSLGNTFPLVNVPCYIIMPDHIHMIIMIMKKRSNTSATTPRADI